MLNGNIVIGNFINGLGKIGIGLATHYFPLRTNCAYRLVAALYARSYNSF